MRLEQGFPGHNHEDRSLWRPYLPHARCTLESDLVSRDFKVRIDLMWKFGMCVYQEGGWDEAEASFEQVRETHWRVLGPEHPFTLTSIGNLASAYRNKGRWDEAEELEVQVMETPKRVLRPEHPDTLTSMNNLSFT
jgi:Tetratricopeptide repeat